MKVRELQLSSDAIWQMIYLRMVFTNPNNPVCGSIVSLLIMQLSWLNLKWLTQGYQQHSTIDRLKLERYQGKGYAKFIMPLPLLSIFLTRTELDVSFSFSSWFYSLQFYSGFSPLNSTLTCWSLPDLMKLVFLLGSKAVSAGQLYAVTSSFVVKELS